MTELTPRQRTVLETLVNRNPMSAKRIGVRSDVLWRMEELGLVGRSNRNASNVTWFIRDAGRRALEEEE